MAWTTTATRRPTRASAPGRDALADCVDSEVFIADVADEVWEGAAKSCR